MFDMKDGDNHEWSDQWCSRTERVIHGRAAQTLLDSEELPEGDCALVVLPQWLWEVPAIDVGRKGRAKDGGLVKLPIRMEWPAPLVVMESSSTTTARWSASGMGHELSGRIIIEVSDSPASYRHTENHIVPFANGDFPTRFHVHKMTRSALRETLNAMVEDGKIAWWEIISDLEGLVRKKVESAHTALSIEISGNEVSPPALLDDHLIDAMVNRMIIGDYQTDETGKEPVVNRIMERAMTPGKLNNVDPLKYISDSLRRDAYATIQKQIGDPHIGAKIRRVARENNTTDIKVISESYRCRYPKEDGIGRVQITAALSVPSAIREVSLDARI